MRRLGIFVGVALLVLMVGGAAILYLRPMQATEPTALDIALAMQACVPIETLEGDADFIRIKIRDYRWDGGTIMPNERRMIGNAAGHPHPVHTHLALVFARGWPALWASPEGSMIIPTERQIVACFESVDLRPRLGFWVVHR